MVDFGSLVPVKFEINGKQITMPELLKRGHLRHHVLQLFTELEKKGFGVYTLGRRGPGTCAKFDPNDKCPVAFTIFAEAKPPKKAVETEPEAPTPEPVGALDGPTAPAPELAAKKVTLPPAVQPKVASPLRTSKHPEDEEAEETTFPSQTLHSLWSLSKILVKDATSDLLGYECSVFADQILVLHRIRGGGVPSIDEALKNIWSTVERRILATETRDTNRFEEVVSQLMGVGLLVLTPVGCTCGVVIKKQSRSKDEKDSQ